MPMTDPHALDEEIVGLDALDLPIAPSEPRLRRFWSATWPKVAAGGLTFALWQAVVWSGWKTEYLLPGPGAVLTRLWDLLRDGTLTGAAAITLRRAATGFSLAILIGSVVGSLVSRVGILRAAFGSLITGLQTMPSIAWFPFAILLWGASEGAILFVVVLGAAPAIAGSLLTGSDHIPPILLRAGRVLGARGFSYYWHVVLPASLPAFIIGLKQGWAFAWRSLMAGELLVVVAGKPSIGFLLQTNRDLLDAVGLLATMLLILAIGIVVDALVFGTLDRTVRKRWGLLKAAS